MAKTSSGKPAGERTTSLLPRKKPSGKSRRTDVRRSAVAGTPSWRKALNEPAFVYGVGIVVLLAIVAATLVGTSRRQQWLVAGDIAPETRIVRIDFEIPDEVATQEAREAAREATPLHFRLEDARLGSIRTALEDLPEYLSKYETFEELDDDTKSRFGLDAARFREVRDWASRNEEWNERITDLLDRVIPSRPILSEADVADVIERGIMVVRDTEAGVETVEIDSSDVLRANGKPDEARSLARAAGFTNAAADVVAHRLAIPAEPTFKIDPAATYAARDAAAKAVPPETEEHRQDEIVYRRGDVVTEAQLSLAWQEESTYRAGSPRVARWGSRLGQIGLPVLLVSALSVYMYFFYPRVVRNSLRVLALAASLALLLLLACTLSVADPHSVYLTALAPIILFGMTLAIVYDQRLAMAATAIFALLVTTAVHQSIGFYVLALAGTGMAVSQLPEVRQRNTLMRAGILSAAMLGITTFIVQFLEEPLVPGVVRAITTDAALAALSGLLVSLFILGILPTIERLFDVTTGLKLVELRDTKQPLLRELQQRAPGTFNHSLTIASIGENAAEAIGADPLLTYVGGLYHDIGKMNKPDYFIENQGSGYNKHAKLRPAMSLLVIVGHVKDGIEMAREFGLPRQIIHFVESHHGTTLVEYFFHAAREQAAENPEQDAPSELEYRYPGPKPRTREAAILMLCDCVESATRAMADPTPSRIESLVHELARRRLLDGQFDDCALTLRELKLIEGAIIKSMCAIYHGRISYPEAKDAKTKDERREATPSGEVATA
jgi:cyclic-di-AMP phosphodiesterase PgpH